MFRTIILGESPLFCTYHAGNILVGENWLGHFQSVLVGESLWSGYQYHLDGGFGRVLWLGELSSKGIDELGRLEQQWSAGVRRVLVQNSVIQLVLETVFGNAERNLCQQIGDLSLGGLVEFQLQEFESMRNGVH